DAGEHGVDRGVGRCRVDPGHADAGIGFVDSAVGVNTQIGFQWPLAGAETRGAVIAGAGVDLVELDHVASRQPISHLRVKYTASRISASATACNRTSVCISLFEVNPEPPRIMLMRPRTRTITTATMTRMAR